MEMAWPDVVGGAREPLGTREFSAGALAEAREAGRQESSTPHHYVFGEELRVMVAQ